MDHRWAAWAGAGIVAGCGGATEPMVVASGPSDGAVPIPIPVAVETSVAREPLRRAPTTPAVAADPGCSGRSHDCKGLNDCKGLGGCKTDGMHDCKGQNECKGKGGCKVCD